MLLRVSYKSIAFWPIKTFRRAMLGFREGIATKHGKNRATVTERGVKRGVEGFEKRSSETLRGVHFSNQETIPRRP
jgi:hypothetical protein